MNYRVKYVGLAEGYDIEETTEDVDNFYIFNTFKEARLQAICNAESDVLLVKDTVTKARDLRLSDVFKKRGI